MSIFSTACGMEWSDSDYNSIIRILIYHNNTLHRLAAPNPRSAYVDDTKNWTCFTNYHGLLFIDADTDHVYVIIIIQLIPGVSAVTSILILSMI